MPLANHASCIHTSPNIFQNVVWSSRQLHDILFVWKKDWKGKENQLISFFEISGNNFYEVGIRSQKDDNSQPILTIHSKNILNIKIEGDGTLWEFQIQWMSWTMRKFEYWTCCWEDPKKSHFFWWRIALFCYKKMHCYKILARARPRARHSRKHEDQSDAP